MITFKNMRLLIILALIGLLLLIWSSARMVSSQDCTRSSMTVVEVTEGQYGMNIQGCPGYRESLGTEAELNLTFSRELDVANYYLKLLMRKYGQYLVPIPETD